MRSSDMPLALLAAAELCVASFAGDHLLGVLAVVMRAQVTRAGGLVVAVVACKLLVLC